MCALTECTSTMFCIWPNDGSMSRNMSQNFFILYWLPIYRVIHKSRRALWITLYVLFIDGINYYIIAKHNWVAPFKTLNRSVTGPQSRAGLVEAMHLLGPQGFENNILRAVRHINNDDTAIPCCQLTQNWWHRVFLRPGVTKLRSSATWRRVVSYRGIKASEEPHALICGIK
jgi:hypothetical protein